MSEITTDAQLNSATEDMGALWLNFTDLLIPEQADILNRAYDLVTLSLNENMLSVTVSTILIDESLETTNQVNLIKKTLLDAVVEILTKMGVIINVDFVDLDELTPLSDILDVLYSTDQIDDVLGLIDILDNETYDNKDKLIQVILRFLQKESFESDSLDYIIEEVSGDVIKGLYIGLGVYTVEDGDYINPDIAKRIKANKEFLQGTRANTHILDGGGVGLSYEIYTKLFINDIAVFLTDSTKRYMEEMMAICLISSLTNVEIEDGFESLIKDEASSMEDIYLGTSILKRIKL